MSRLGGRVARGRSAAAVALGVGTPEARDVRDHPSRRARAHGLDITEPLGVPFPDTDRLRHVAWLAHGSLPYAFAFASEEPQPVHCELTAPDGSTWRYGPPDSASTVSGLAGAFCRVGARRLAPDESGLVAHGSHFVTALRAMRNYAG